MVVLAFGNFISLAQSPFPQDTYFYSINVLTNSIAASSTNNLKGASVPITRGVDGIRLTLAATGIAATTNAPGTTNGFTVFFETSPDGGATYDSGQFSFVKLNMTTMGSAVAGPGTTNVISDWFNMAGVTRLRAGRIENQLLGAVSNITVIISYPFPQQVKPQ